MSRITFISDKIKKEFLKLSSGRYEDREIYKMLKKAFKELEKNPYNGVKIQKKLWPKEYNKYNITNLWKYDLPNGWRLIYTIEKEILNILTIVLEWFNHKNYEKKFNYKIKEDFKEY